MVIFQLSARRFWHAPASPIIRAFTWGLYSHFDFVLPNGRLLGALMLEGVVIHDAAPDYLRRDRFELIGAPDTVYDAALSQLGKPYDYTAIFGIGMHRDWDTDDAWHCCELGMWACYQAGYIPLNTMHLNRVLPDHWLMSPYVRRLVA